MPRGVRDLLRRASWTALTVAPNVRRTSDSAIVTTRCDPSGVRTEKLTSTEPMQQVVRK
jgi:hypothetical protein